MPKKTYRTFFLKKLYTYVRDEEGNKIPVEFQGGIQIDSTSKFVTSSEMLQKGLESSPAFGRDYYLESEVEEDEPKKESAKPAAKKAEDKPAEPAVPLGDIKDIKRFHNLVEMKNYMAELGIEGVSEMNYLQAKAAALKEGYDFQISKA